MLKGTGSLWLLVLTAALTVPLAIFNPWVSDAPDIWKIWRGGLLLCLIVFSYSGVGIFLSSYRNTADEAQKPLPAEPVKFGTIEPEAPPHPSKSEIRDTRTSAHITASTGVHLVGGATANSAVSAVKITDQNTVQKIGARIRAYIPTWTVRDIKEVQQIELVGRFVNDGDMDASTTITSEIFINGLKVAEVVTSEDFAAPSTLIPAGWKGPLLYLVGPAYDAAINTPTALTVRVQITYSNGIGADLLMDNHVSFYPNLQIGASEVTSTVKK